MSVEVVFGPTPNGGVKSEAVYVDKDNKPVSKEQAEWVIIRELDANGNPIYETFLMLVDRKIEKV